ncbi:MAG: chemotaxis response regulator protein-glutamate methylesterase [Pirellulaceae bacterium]
MTTNISPLAPPPLRVLVVDDSALYRKIVRTILESSPGVQVVGTASNGRTAMELIREEKPDLVTLDLEMPQLDGLGVLRALRDESMCPGVIMLSAHTGEGANATMQALRLGAFDFVLKPAVGTLEQNTARLQSQLIPKVLQFASSRPTVGRAVGQTPTPAASTVRPPTPESPPSRRHLADHPLAAIGIGVSTGGPVALSHLVPSLPGDLPAPVFIVQHMPPVFTKSLADDLDRHSAITVMEAEDGMVPAPGCVYLAKGGFQMKVENCGDGVQVRVTSDPPEKSCRPSVDYLFRSLAHVYGGRALGLIMTGMGDDGALGSQLMKRAGARIVAQEASTCVVYGMPRVIVEKQLADSVLPLDQLAGAIVHACAERVNS